MGRRESGAGAQRGRLDGICRSANNTHRQRDAGESERADVPALPRQFLGLPLS